MLHWVGLLILGSLGLTLLELAFFVNFTVMKNPIKANAESAYYVLRSLFWAIMFLALVFISGNRNMAKGGAPQYGAAPDSVPPQPPQMAPVMGYNATMNPSPAPMAPGPNNGAAAYPAPYHDTTADQPKPQDTMSPPPPVPYPQNTASPPPPASYPQGTASPPPPAAYNNNPSYSPYNGGNVNYTSVDAPQPPQPYYH